MQCAESSSQRIETVNAAPVNRVSKWEMARGLYQERNRRRSMINDQSRFLMITADEGVHPSWNVEVWATSIGMRRHNGVLRC